MPFVSLADYCTPHLRSFKMAGSVGELYRVDRTGTQEGEFWKDVPEGTRPVEPRTLGGMKAHYRGR